MWMDFSPEIDRVQFARMFGGKDFHEFSHALNTKIDTYTEGMDELLSPQLNYRKLEIASAEHGIFRLTEGTAFKSHKLSRVMRQCAEAVFFIATIGAGIENKIRRLTARNRLSDAFVIDTMGSLLVEELVNQFQNEMRGRYRREGRAISLRFSPGYCDWPIEEQKKLFDLFNEDLLEVTLSDTCLMSPRKSISGVFGISYQDTRPWVAAHNPCRECAKKDCNERRSTLRTESENNTLKKG